MVLTGKQKEELNKAIIEYLQANGYPQTATKFGEESATTLDASEKSAIAGVLEKKWVSVLRLQKKVMELEQKIESLNEELKTSAIIKNPNAAGASGAEMEELMPKSPAKNTFDGHRGVITRVCFHPQYTLIASASEDASIKFWDYETGQYEKQVKGHTGAINDIAFDFSGKFLASASSDLTIKLWDLATYQSVKTFNGHDHSVSTVEFVPTAGDYLVSASRDKSLKLWEIATGYCLRTFVGHTEWVRCATIDESGKMLASCSQDQNVIIWNIDNPTPHLMLSEHTHVVERVLFIKGPKAKQYISEGEFRKGPQTAEEEKAEGNAKKPGKSKDAAASEEKYANMRFVLSGARDKAIKLWDAVTGSCLFTFLGHDNWVRGLALHHSGRYFYSCSDDKSIRIWDLSSGKCTKKMMDAHNHFVSTIASSGRYLYIASGSVDNTVKVWQLK